ncbi:unnamed protein product [Rhizoctonia solani]|uniref:Uncharacterized protein n=1 Tax=Rhizoctonia solani TaxID=456999 RepID=A0A8H3I3D2_9AGAM|nr:unnamed protein product [Rhizoctonia solani]
MSESIGKPWIESSVVEILVDHELPSPPKLQGRAQIVKFLTFREDAGAGNQPKDRNTVLWAEITDGEWFIPVRIANEATNKIEDEYKRGLTYYRRGFFTLRAAVSFDFVVTQVNKSQTKLSPLKQLFLNIVELRYISGGGPGVPVATRGVVLREPLAFPKWVQALNTGGQTLTNLQAQERAAKQSSRVSTISRRSKATNASKRPSKAPIKTSAQSVTPQPSINNLAVKREWQDDWFGKRHKLHEIDYTLQHGGLEPTADQQAKLEGVILERAKMATSTHPYDPTNMVNSLSVPDRPSIASTARSSQIIRSSQVASSTPIDTRLPRTKLAEPQLRAPVVVDEPITASSEAGSDGEDSDSDHAAPARLQHAPKPAVNQTNRVGESKSHIPTPRPSDTRADMSDEEASSGVEETPQWLESDDAITEQMLSQVFASSNQGRKMPTVLVPDSSSPNPSQHSTQVRHSSPWDCEDELPSERDASYSPEAIRRNPGKGERQLGSALSSPSRSILDAAHDEPTSSQSIDQVTSSAKHRDESQPSAAASLPSPPPEDLNGHKINLQQEPALSRRAISPTSNLRHSSDVASKKDLNEQEAESFETRRKVEQITSRKRRLSQSPNDDVLHVQIPQELVSPQNGKPNADNKRRLRRRLEDPHVPASAHKNAPHQPNFAREGLTNECRGASKSTADVIPHDHDAWANPSWMNNAPAPKQVRPEPIKAPRASEAQHLDRPQARRISQPSTKLRILQPPFHHPTRIVERAPSPGFPPVTASQFADADEDFGVTRPPTIVRPANTPVASTSRASNTDQSRTTSGLQPAASTPGPSKQSRRSNKATGSGTATPQDRERIIRNGGHDSKGQLQPKSAWPVTAHHPTPDSSLTSSVVRPDDSTIDTARSLSGTTAHQPYLGGFRPSIAVDLPQKYRWTWENWLEVTKDAYSFWYE